MAGVTALFVLETAGAARGQLFRPGTWQGMLEGVVDFSRQDTDTGGSPQSTFETRLTEERLTLRNNGAHFYNPRLLTLSVAGTFGLSQEEFMSNGSSNSSDADLWGYDAFASILSQGFLSLNLFANRNQFFLPGPLVGLTKIRNEVRGATLFARRLYVPSSVTIRQDTFDEQTHTGDVVSRRENEVNTITYEGQRGWIDSEMGISYQLVDNTDKVFPNLSYRSHDGGSNYSLEFGPELNRRWDSRTRYITRTGGSGQTDLTTATVDELLRLDHTETFATDYRYLFIYTDTSGGTATTHSGTINLNHELYQRLTSIAGLDTVIQTLSGGEKDTYGGRLGFLYTKHLPGTGRLIAALRGRLQYEDDRFDEETSFAPQETHTAATPFALPIPLDNPFVITSSVIVTKIATGPLPVGCIPPPGPPTPLVLGQDYTLDTVGSITEIVPIPCAGTIVGINPGDTIAVDYQFEVPSALTFTTGIWNADLTLDYGWIRSYYAHQQVEQTLISGTDGQFLDDQQSDTLGIEWRYDGNRTRGSILGEVRRFASDRLTYNSARSVQFLVFPIFSDLMMSLSGYQSYFDFADPDRKSTSFGAAATLTYIFTARLSADASAGIRRLDDTSLPSDQTIEAALRLRWHVQELEVNPSVEFYDLRRGDTDTKEIRTLLRVIRRF